MKVVVKKRDPSIPVNIGTEFIKLDAALKYANAVESGGMAKAVIQEWRKNMLTSPRETP